MDYQVFLVSRMREEYVKTKNPVQAIQAGLKHSGPVVTMTGLIMIFVFAGFIFAGEASIKANGLALSFGVLFDAFIVRMTLIPSIMKLMGECGLVFTKVVRQNHSECRYRGSSTNKGDTARDRE